MFPLKLTRINSHRRQFLAALLLLLFLAAGAMATIYAYFSRRAVDIQAEMLARQGGFRLEAMLRELVTEAHAQIRVMRELLAVQTGPRVDFVPVLTAAAPVFGSRPLLSYAGLAREEDGEYAMLERAAPDEIKLWHYTVLPDGTRAIRNYRIDLAGRLALAETRPWEGYDPRQRPFYRLAREAHEPVWTDSYLFFPYQLRPDSLGVTLAEPWRNAEGRLLGVLDADFDTHALNGFLAELQNSSELRAMLVEWRHDGTLSVVAHSDYALAKSSTGAELTADPLAQACLKQLVPLGQSRIVREKTLRFTHAGTTYLGVATSLGRNFPRWEIVVLVPTPVVATGFAAMHAAMMLALLIVLMLGVLVATWLSQRVARPLVRLAEDVGNLTDAGEGVVREEGPSEVLRLAQRFNNLTGRIRARQGELASAEAVARQQAESLKRTNEALAEITQLLGPELDFEQSLRRINEVSARALNVHAVTIWLLDEVTGIARQVDVYLAATGEHRPGIVLPPGAYPRLRARFTASRCVLVPEVEFDPDYADYYRDHLSHLGRVSLLQSAVRSRGNVIGLVAFLCTDPAYRWTLEDQLFAGALADVLSLHMETAARSAAEAKIKQRSERLQRQEVALSRATRSLTLREGLLEPAFRELNEVCTEGLAVNRASIWLIRRDEQRLQLIDLYDKKRGAHSTGQVIDLALVPLYFQAMQNDRFLVADDVLKDPRLAEFGPNYLAPLGICSLLDAGIFSRGELVGVVCFEHVEPGRHWEQEEEIFAGAVADLAALALEAAARRTAEEQMERSRERLRLHIEGTPLAAIDWDQQVNIIGWNPAAEHIYGYGREEVLGRNGLFLVPPSERARMAEVWRELTIGRSNYISRATNLTKDGRIIYCEWHNTVLRDGQDRMIGVTSMIEDVTARVRAEEEIKQLNAGLENRVAERTAALEAANDKLQELDRLKSEFLATMSHELRTPLNSIIGFTGIIKGGLAGPVNEEQRKQLELVYGSAKHLLGLINDILDMSRVEAGRLQLEFAEFPPAEVLAEAMNTLLPMARLKQLVCVVEEADPALKIICDRKRFFQIVVNLVNNAVKFTEQGGVRVTMRAEGDRLWVRVADTGPGIRTENIGGLFEAFRQVDGSARRVYEGTGLGLYLCRKLLHLLGGEIGVESEYGHGSTFWFWVPLTLSSEPEAASDVQSDSTPS